MENGHQSFDFKEEDELTEYAAGNFVTKYHNPNHDNYGVLKYDLLECGEFLFLVLWSVSENAEDFFNC